MSCLRRREREVLVERLSLNFDGISRVSLSLSFFLVFLDQTRLGKNKLQILFSFFPSNENLTQSHTYVSSFSFLFVEVASYQRGGPKRFKGLTKSCIPVM